jgi:predicted lipid-binding transport protein (Tim44 family)
MGTSQLLGSVPFISQTAAKTNTPRLPQDLSKFIAEGTITQATLNDPNTVLRDANLGKSITKTVSFTVSTHSATPDQGGGTTNIAFLRGAAARLTGALTGGLTGGLFGGITGGLAPGLAGAATGTGPNAEAVQMSATFWVETVQHSIVVPPFKPGQVSVLH